MLQQRLFSLARAHSSGRASSRLRRGSVLAMSTSHHGIHLGHQQENGFKRGGGTNGSWVAVAAKGSRSRAMLGVIPSTAIPHAVCGATGCRRALPRAKQGMRVPAAMGREFASLTAQSIPVWVSCVGCNPPLPSTYFARTQKKVIQKNKDKIILISFLQRSLLFDRISDLTISY